MIFGPTAPYRYSDLLLPSRSSLRLRRSWICKEIFKSGPHKAYADQNLYIGELEQLNDEQWERLVKDFFRR